MRYLFLLFLLFSCSDSVSPTKENVDIEIKISGEHFTTYGSKHLKSFMNTNDFISFDFDIKDGAYIIINTNKPCTNKPPLLLLRLKEGTNIVID